MPELNLKQLGFTYNLLVDQLLNIVKEFKTQRKKKLKNLPRNELDKACFAHDVAYSESEDLAKITISDKILKDRAYKIARNRNYYRYQRTLSSKVLRSISFL